MRAIPDPGYADDDGSTAPAVAAALREVAAGAPLHVAVAALCDARLLVPVVAVTGEAGYDQPPPPRDEPADKPADKTADRTDMAAVLLTGRDGRRALLAFTSLSALRTWDQAARPVPVSTQAAAQAVLAEGADALVVDVGGPVQVPIEGDAVRRLAAGQRLVRSGGDWAWAAPLA